ncbi:MAG TPA: YciI family protein [Candidatus Limnocylindria bacterium]|nr:YciI family protein [Candidatus Limnocylindria bacterium]
MKMRYVMLTYVDPADIAIWEGWTPEEQAADVDRHRAWFAKFRDKVVSGEELDEPKHVKSLRRGRQDEGVVVIDGPYVETKELLGGFVVIEAADMDEAIAIASEWPSLSSMPNATVQVQPVFVRD